MNASEKCRENRENGLEVYAFTRTKLWLLASKQITFYRKWYKFFVRLLFLFIVWDYFKHSFAFNRNFELTFYVYSNWFTHAQKKNHFEIWSVADSIKQSATYFMTFRSGNSFHSVIARRFSNINIAPYTNYIRMTLLRKCVYRNIYWMCVSGIFTRNAIHTHIANSEMEFPLMCVRRVVYVCEFGVCVFYRFISSLMQYVCNAYQMWSIHRLQSVQLIVLNACVCLTAGVYLCETILC